MKKTFINQALFRYRDSILVPNAVKEESEDTSVLVASAVLNLMSQGFLPTQELFDSMKRLPEKELVSMMDELMTLIQEALGSDVKHEPMYPNFPAQVMEANEAEQYLIAIFHYLSDGQWMPEFEKLERPALNQGKERPVGAADIQTYHTIFTNLMKANSPLSSEDQEYLSLYLTAPYAPKIPEDIPIKETSALVQKMLYQAKRLDAIRKLLKTPTDVLRFSQIIVDGDASLRNVKRFGPYSRPVRRFMLSVLDRCRELAPEMLVHKAMWLRFGEAVHPGEEANRKLFPKAAEAFDQLRSGARIYSYDAEVEAAISAKNFPQLVTLLSKKPGVFARRLDHVLRLAETKEQQTQVLSAWHKAAPQVSTRVLLQILQFFKNRDMGIRVFRPAAATNAVFVQEETIPPLDDVVRCQAAFICENALKQQFAGRDYMGLVYIDPAFKKIAMPLQQRSTSAGFHVLPKYSRIPLSADAKTIRAFLYWENAVNGSEFGERTDLDLSMAFFDGDFAGKGVCSYYEMVNGDFACHSGDIVTAPIGTGASEFVDIDLEKAKAAGIRYAICSVQTYTSRPFSELETCYAGWMVREDAQAGEVFEPATVESKFHLTGDRMDIAFILDLENMEMIWLDEHSGEAKGLGGLINNMSTRIGFVTQLTKAIVETEPLYIQEVLDLHVAVRGLPAAHKEEADMVFSMEEGITPYNTDTLLAYI